MELKEIALKDIRPYERNPRRNDQAVDAVMKSIQQCEYIAPIVLDENNVVLAGHTRLKALKRLGYNSAQCVIKTGLTEEQKRKYRLLDNKTNELAEWDFDQLVDELDGLDFGNLDLDWKSEFDNALNTARENGVADEEYNEFVDKFKPKLTTDDCFTPPPVYTAVKNWAVKEYVWEDKKVVRPFYPNGDYKSYNYEGAVVIDNPPFSIISEIVGFYEDNGIDYFLFAPHLTCLGIRRAKSRLAVGVNVIYENGANVSTSFVCSRGATIRTAPSLYRAVDKAAKEYARELKAAELPNYEYPMEVMTASRLHFLSKYLEEEFSTSNCVRISELDAQKAQGKGIFGSAYLIGSAKAAEAAKAVEAAKAAKAVEAAKAAKAVEAAKAFVWELSDREKEIVNALDEKSS